MNSLPEIGMMVIFVASLMVTRNLAHPASLQPFVWLVALSSLKLFEDSFFPVPEETRYIFVFSSAAFSIGAFYASQFVMAATPVKVQNVTIRDFTIPLLLLSGYCILKIRSMSQGAITLEGFAELRSSLTEDDGAEFGLPGTVALMMSVYIVAAVFDVRRRYVRLCFVVASWIVLSLLLLAKFNFIFLISSLVFLANYNGQLRVKHLLFAGGCLVSLFILITFMRHSENVDDANFLLDFVKVYLTSGIPAFSESIRGIEPKFVGYTFRVPFLWMNKIGADLPVQPLIQEWVFVPLPTNIYTYLHPYYLEMGVLGAVMFPLFVGVVHGFFHGRAVSGDYFSRVYSSILMYALIMQAFIENYFVWFSNWVYFALLLKFVLKYPRLCRSV